ncbi:MAG: BatA domain-containing protein [Bacteroidales bacterium]|nr:BatA domain-containing protein [Bacteroidales bacterium]MBR4786883.1 BatA domain-containing protein [Bacteroidales bacterium]
MAFSNPLLLIGLSAILVPIIIHLFNFRRYKTIYFSNVKMLEEIKKKTKREQTLQQLIVLALRILGIAALALAFAQPYIPSGKQKSRTGNLVTIFLDNSHSMEANSKEGKTLYDAVDAAKNIVNAFGFNDDFVLTTHDFTGEQTHILNKDQILEMLDKVQASPNSHTLAEVLAFEKNTCTNSQKGNVVHYYLSDFQKNNFNIALLGADSATSTFLIPLPTEAANNVGIDSCWFLSPVFKVGNQVTYFVRIHNYGKEEVNKVPVKLYINDKQKAVASPDIPAGAYVDCRMVYNIEEPGTQCGRVVIEDAPITFDDQLFFTYEVTDNTRIAAIHGKERNRFLDALYGRDSVFDYLPMAYTQVNYTQLKQCEVIVLSDVPTISSGLADELSKFVKGGGTLLVFPPKEMDNTYNRLLSSLGAASYGALAKKELKCGQINTESQYYKNALESQREKLDMPVTLQHYDISGGSGGEVVMALENGSPLLAVYPVERGKVILSAVGMDDVYGNAHRHALFFVPLHNIGIMSAMQNKLYNTIGKDRMQTIASRTGSSDEVLTLRSRGHKEEFIPEQRRIGNETALYFHDQVKEGGLFDIINGGAVMGTLAFNQDRKESDLDCYDADELTKMAKASGKEIDVIAADTKNIAKSVADRLNGKPLWPYFIIFALLCLLAEIALLRFWGKPTINNERNSEQIS